MTTWWAVSLVLLAQALGCFGPIMLKMASGRMSFNIRKLLINYYLFGGLFFYAVGTVLFIPALKGGDLSVLYPLVATVYIWVSIWSIVLLKERMNAYKWLGIAFILVGVAFIGIGS